MYSKKLILLKSSITICMVLLANFSFAQTTANEMAKKMHPGINLGNTFDAHGYEGNWAPATTEKDFEAFKQAGFSCVRIPITWGSSLSENDATLRLDSVKPYKVNDTFFTRLDEVLKWSLDRGLITIINVHHDTWLKQTDAFDANKDRFYSAWKQIAKRYKDYPEQLIFEMLNEPHHSTNGKEDGLTQTQVDEVNKETLAIIRKNNPTRIVIYTGPGWSALNDLANTVIPDANDKYLIGTYHSYTPWNFAGDGNGSWGTDKDKENMANEFTNLKAYSDKYNVPVFIGEYSANQQCNYNDRMLHFACYIENIVKNEVAATNWDDGGHRFKNYDRITGQWDDAKDIIVNYTPESPEALILEIEDGNFVKLKWKNRAENIEKVTIEHRLGRAGNFKQIEEIKTAETYTDKSKKNGQSTHYYRVVNHLKDGSKLMGYPQSVYIP